MRRCVSRIIRRGVFSIPYNDGGIYMKLIDAYYNYKNKYKEYVVLLKSGIFYECFNDDIGIIYSLFHYKIKNRGNSYVVGFPSNSLSRICSILEENKINYIVADKDNIIDKYKTKNNQYNKYYIDLNRLQYITYKIEDIYNRLNNKILDDDIEKILLNIGDML